MDFIMCLLGPVFSVPGVRKLALQSAVPMANVVTRPRASITEDTFLSDLAGICCIFCTLFLLLGVKPASRESFWLS